MILKNKKIGPSGGAVVKVLALHAGDPIWALVLSQQPRFPSISLLVAWESSRGQPKALGPCTHVGDRKRILASDRHSIDRCAHLGSESSDGRSSSLSLLLLSVYLTL